MNRKRQQNWMAYVKFGLLTAAGVFLLARGTARLGYHWQWYRIPEYLIRATDDGLAPGLLAKGLWVTVQITAAGLVLAFFIGLAVALCRMSPSRLARWTARLYLEAVRNTPLLVQIFFIYFVAAPALGIQRFAAAVLALSLFEGAYASEILRSGITSIQRHQFEAAASLGLNWWQIYRLVILPQAVRRVLPPLTGQGISLIKDSALVSTIAIYDLTMQGQAIVARTFLVFEVWFTVAAIYLLVTATLSGLVRRMEKQWQWVH